MRSGLIISLGLASVLMPTAAFAHTGLGDGSSFVHEPRLLAVRTCVLRYGARRVRLLDRMATARKGRRRIRHSRRAF